MAQWIQPSGPRDAKIVVVGRDCGWEEIRDGRGFCLVPETKVLMSDLTWHNLGDIRVGNEILTCEEHPSATIGKTLTSLRKRRWRKATVTAVHRRIAPTIILTMPHGSLQGTQEHRVLLRGYGEASRYRTFRELVARDTQTKSKRSSWLQFVCQPWEISDTRSGGWLAGFVDGEGWLSWHTREGKRQRADLGWAQKEGTLNSHARQLAVELGFHIGKSEKSVAYTGSVICHTLIRGGFTAIVHFLGAVRPFRLLEKFTQWLDESPDIGMRTVDSPLLSKQLATEREVIDITTTQGTFIANGFVVHNCGASGKLLWHPTRQSGAADKAGLARNECLVTNCVNRQPEHNDWSKHHESDVARGMDELHALLEASPRVLVVALGEHAGLACAGIVPSLDSKAVSAQFADRFGDSITNVRGYVYTGSAVYPILVALHPAFILRNWHPWWATFCWDWQKAARIMRQGAFVPHIVQVEVLTTTEAIVGWWGGVAPGTLLANDCETQGTGCVGFADTPWHAVVVPGAPSSAHPHFDLLVSILNNDKGVEFVLQNGQFDQTMYGRAGMVPKREWPQFRHDLMLGWHAAEPLLAGQREDARGKGKRKTEKSLEFLAGLLLDGAQRWKNYQFAEDSEQFRLCGIDCGYTLGAWLELEKRLAAP